MSQNPTDNTWLCEKNSKYHANPQYRYVVSMVLGDSTETQWTTFFNDQVEDMLGETADDMFRLMQDNPAGFKEKVDKLKHLEGVVKLRVTSEEYQGAAKTKCAAQSFARLDYLTETKALIAAIHKYQ